jgi:alpha-ketoglutarate-dependent taurine dioxygenase
VATQSLDQLMLRETIPPPRAWTAADLSRSSGLIPLPGKAIDELRAAITTLRAHPLPTALLTRDDVDLPACRAVAEAARAQLEQGIGFVVLDRLPLDEWTPEEAIAAYWLLMIHLARPVAQNWAGQVIYDVTDAGQGEAMDRRRDKTNADLNFHTDNSYNLAPPRYVALLCLRPALSGGISGLVSLAEVHNRLLRDNPAVLNRLYRDFLFNRQKEHAPGDALTVSHPIFELRDGELRGRLSRLQVIYGHRVAGVEMDAETLHALDAFEATMMDPALRHDYVFERGQVQVVHNLRCAHRRTEYVDPPEPELKRRLVRLWLRDAGRRSYHG